MPHLINPGGRMVAVDNLEEFEKLKALPGFTVPSDEEVEAHVKERYAAQANMVAPDDPARSVYIGTVTQGEKNGYGSASNNLIKELRNLGVNIQTYNKDQKIGFLFHAPYSVARMEHPVKIVYTMFESDKIPDEWIEFLQMADKVLVPSKWCQSVFAKSGIETEVVPLGYDDDIYKPIVRPNKSLQKEDFVYLHYNAFNLRKGHMEVFEAFVKAFNPMEPVKLVLKTTAEQLPPIAPNPTMYPKIQIVQGQLEEKDMLDLMGKADAFVFPSRGEGFGIPPLEAMATGLPTIVPNASGMSEYFNPEYMYEAKVAEKIVSRYSRYKAENEQAQIAMTGYWDKIDVDQLAKQMRYIYEHQIEAANVGAKASEWVKNWTYKKTAARLKEIFDEYLKKEVIEKPINNILVLEEVR